MNCPECNGRMNVSVTQPKLEGKMTYRRYVCQCGHRLSTLEQEVQVTSTGEIDYIDLSEVDKLRSDLTKRLTSAIEQAVSGVRVRRVR